MTDTPEDDKQRLEVELAALTTVARAISTLETPGAKARVLLHAILAYAPEGFSDDELSELFKSAREP